MSNLNTEVILITPSYELCVSLYKYLSFVFSLETHGQLAATVSDLKNHVENTNNSLNALKTQLTDLGLISSGKCTGEGAHMSCCTNKNPCGLGEGKDFLFSVSQFSPTTIISTLLSNIIKFRRLR